MTALPKLVVPALTAFGAAAAAGPETPWPPAIPGHTQSRQQPVPPGTIRVQVRLVPVDVVVTGQRDRSMDM